LKREALTHPKLHTLARRLGGEHSLALARGILEGVWHLGGQHAPDGDLTRFSPEEIATFVGWTRPGRELMDMLIECRWLDSDGEHTVIHDWADHADGSVHKKLARGGKRFSNGERPILSYLGGPKSPDRKAAEARYKQEESTRIFRGSSMESSQSPARALPESSKDADSADAASAKDLIFHFGVPSLLRAGLTRQRAAAILGSFVRDFGEKRTAEIVARAVAEKPLDPVSFMRAQFGPSLRVVNKDSQL
jgi:hypothetical protein